MTGLTLIYGWVFFTALGLLVSFSLGWTMCARRHAQPSAIADGVEAPYSLLWQALEALELSQPLPGHEDKWSAAINAIYAAPVSDHGGSRDS